MKMKRNTVRVDFLRRAILAVGMSYVATIALAPVSIAEPPPPPVGDEHGPVQPYIVNGREATKPYSFMASLQLADGRHFCGASLIDQKWLVTAAHCLINVVPGQTVVRVGSLDRTAGGSVARVSRAVQHPKFDMALAGNDVALLELETPVRERPIAIGADAGRVGTPTIVMGWGVTCDRDLNDPACRSAIPRRLQELDTRLVADSECSNLAAGLELCTKSRHNEFASACFGDSGGPQVKESRSGRPVLIGATVGDGDDLEMRPNVCTTGPDGRGGAGMWTKLAAQVEFYLGTLDRLDPRAAIRVRVATALAR
jgi:secreted trypsin-like serine protease